MTRTMHFRSQQAGLLVVALFATFLLWRAPIDDPMVYFVMNVMFVLALISHYLWFAGEES